jgi:hypothetical protein
MRTADGFACGGAQQPRVDRMPRAEIGDELITRHAIEAVGRLIAHLVEMASEGLPERRAAVRVDIAAQLRDHLAPEPVAVGGHEQVAAAGRQAACARGAHSARDKQPADLRAAVKIVGQHEHVVRHALVELTACVRQACEAVAVEGPIHSDFGEDARGPDDLALAGAAGQLEDEHNGGAGRSRRLLGQGGSRPRKPGLDRVAVGGKICQSGPGRPGEGKHLVHVVRRCRPHPQGRGVVAYERWSRRFFRCLHHSKLKGFPPYVRRITDG